MGRKKTKRFIDKKKATTYKLVHRSQKDPLANDAGQPQMVLQASAADSSGLRQKEEQEEYGIYFDDDYNYLQHLQERGSTLPELSLPSELFGSEVTAAEKLNRVLPTGGPRPDWDPDVVAALEDAEGDGEEGGELEDDFVMLANCGEASEESKETKDESLTADHLWWTARGDFLPPEVPAISLNRSVSSQDNSEVEEKDEEMESRKTAQFTEYSISSSVVPRNKGLSLLDERFEELMCEYDDDQLGALEEEEEEESAVTEEMLLTAAVAEFEQHHQDKIVSWSNVAAALGKCTADGSLRERDREEELSSCSSHDEDTSKPRERWDCESILSTYSNIYNHPKLITEPAPTKRKIKLSRTTGFPAIETLSLNTDASSQVSDQGPPSVVMTSHKNETHEEKQQRKKAVKEERRERRADKKATKMAFRSHRLQQEKAYSSRTANSIAYL